MGLGIARRGGRKFSGSLRDFCLWFSFASFAAFARHKKISRPVFSRAKDAKGAKGKEMEIFLRDLIAVAPAVYRAIRAGSETGAPKWRVVNLRGPLALVLPLNFEF
jgi:hypothetical protein